MIYWITTYVLGYLICVTILTFQDKPTKWEDYGLTGFAGFLWPFAPVWFLLGVFPWFIRKVILNRRK